MNFYINQTITITTLRIDGITNSSVLQIGSAGIIRALSNLYNTGGFVEAAPGAGAPAETLPQPGALIPLAPPSSP